MATLGSNSKSRGRLGAAGPTTKRRGLAESEDPGQGGPTATTGLGKPGAEARQLREEPDLKLPDPLPLPDPAKLGPNLRRTSRERAGSLRLWQSLRLRWKLNRTAHATLSSSLSGFPFAAAIAAKLVHKWDQWGRQGDSGVRVARESGSKGSVPP